MLRSRIFIILCFLSYGMYRERNEFNEIDFEFLMIIFVIEVPEDPNKWLKNYVVFT